MSENEERKATWGNKLFWFCMGMVIMFSIVMNTPDSGWDRLGQNVSFQIGIWEAEIKGHDEEASCKRECRRMELNSLECLGHCRGRLWK